MRNFTKFVILTVCCLTGGVLQAQVREVTITGDIKGLHAVRVCVVTGERGGEPVEMAYAVADNGKFKMTFQEDPSAGKRYAFYIPMLDSERRDNVKSREYFFVDAPKIYLEGVVDGTGIKEFSAPKSKMYKEFQDAKARIDFSAYYAQRPVEMAALDYMHAFQREWESQHQFGDVMSAQDSVEIKRRQALWRQEADKYFRLEHELGLQALAQVSRKNPSRGLNAMVCDHFNGCTAVAMQPVIEKYEAEFSRDYMRRDFYLSQLLDSYIQRSMSRPNAEVYDFPLMTLDGKTVKFGDFKGKYIYANFWDLEDPAYKEQQQALEALYAKYKDSPKVAVVNVSMNRDPLLWRALLTDTELKTPQWSVPEEFNPVFYKSYQVRELPRAVLITPDFRIAEFFMSVPADPKTDARLGDL